jgi:hypothetical protein
MRGQGRMTRIKGGTQCQGRNMDGWYNPPSCPTTQLLKIRVWMPMSFPFSCQNHDTLLCVGVCDSQVLIYISKVLCDAFCEGVEWVAEEDVIGVRGHPSISLLPLSSPTLPLSICISHIPLYHLQGPHSKANDFCIQSPMTFQKLTH